MSRKEIVWLTKRIQLVLQGTDQQAAWWLAEQLNEIVHLRRARDDARCEAERLQRQIDGWKSSSERP